ncbi:MAG TPA: IPExxxVDY family protein [Bacteroidia bacterium]|nr:IPExxxVDY family protein [Bacteroidia bacterium]HNT79236.1 IPExxxVDY family protein [Bacteroidia bacterium]
MAKNVLQFEETYDDILIIGVSSSLKDYKLCFELNKHFYLNLIRVNNFVLDGVEFDRNDSYPIFIDTNNQPEKIHLISNKGDRKFLFDELRKLDYFLIVSYPEKDKSHWINGMRTVKGITAVFHIQPESLKNKFVLQYFD